MNNQAQKNGRMDQNGPEHCGKTMKRNIFTHLLLLPQATSFTLPHETVNLHPKSSRPKTNLKAIDADPSIPIIAAAAIGAWWFSTSDSRAKQAQYSEWEAKEKAYQAEREKLARIEPKEFWTENELKQFNGDDETGPILLAVKGDVFNVWRGRNFYGKDGEYRIMAGRDATRFLAKNRLEEESEEELRVELNVAERANLEMWYWTIKNKYELVGQLEGYDPKSTAM